ncbi:uncharacterized protein LOC131165381 isoform X2 [Malania oleifera]|uniref:uncharacterized protein LOC131165381 isoform X2 n=1 Tax=Malania oleifera TaxID=397392 RepID=UPI0025AEB5AF|nr:uncharacterized protein LOC131165381 isoform X2 [Malania oleifera]
MAHYYDIDDIITEEEIVSVMFQKAANGVGLLDPSAEANCVEHGSKVELPFWIAHELHQRQAALINAPTCFNQKIGDRTIGSLLLIAFRTRYKEVLTKAHTAASILAPKFLALLTKEETHLFEAAQSSLATFKKWRMGGPRFQRASILGRKRKSTD